MSNLETTAQAVVNMCIELLARYPKTEAEILLKIEEYISKSDQNGFSLEERESLKYTVVSRLKTAGLINDKEYLESFIRCNNSSIKPDGSLLIFKKLRQKGIPIALLEQKASDLEEFDKINASKLLNKKFGVSFLSSELTMSEKQKMVAYLTSRGFRYSAISTSEDLDF
jgi:SOS response regulatory protein OraA/RecX